jgi:hypothetical protein
LEASHRKLNAAAGFIKEVLHRAAFTNACFRMSCDRPRFFKTGPVFDARRRRTRGDSPSKNSQQAYQATLVFLKPSETWDLKPAKYRRNK